MSVLFTSKTSRTYTIPEKKVEGACPLFLVISDGAAVDEMTGLTPLEQLQ